jgi:hypothetical protein
VPEKPKMPENRIVKGNDPKSDAVTLIDTSRIKQKE